MISSAAATAEQPRPVKHSLKRVLFIGTALVLGLFFFLRDERLIPSSSVYAPPSSSATTIDPSSSPPSSYHNVVLPPRASTPLTKRPKTQEDDDADDIDDDIRQEEEEEEEKQRTSSSSSSSRKPSSSRRSNNNNLKIPPFRLPSNASSSSSDSDEVLHRARQLCRDTDTTVRLYFPHVNKAGGRTIEGTFDSLSTNPQFRFLAKTGRSLKYKFELVNGHHDYIALEKQFRANSAVTSAGTGDNANANNNANVCSRWIYMMREPLARTLSAFYTSVGRAPPSADEPTTPLTDHFYCDSSKVQLLMQNSEFTFEDFAKLSKADRDTCQDKTGDVQVKYLSRLKNWRVVRRRALDMAFLGLAEEFALSMQLLNWELDLDLQLYTPIFNQNAYPGMSTLSPLALQALRELNELDVQFYDYARHQIFNQRVKAMRRADEASAGQLVRPFVCDKQVICWDKRKPKASSKGGDVFWPSTDNEPPEGVFSSVGEMKSNTLCGMRGGCVAQPAYTRPRLCTASFFILGARKGGTTSMYLYLAQHPKVRAILMDKGAKSGETFFFERQRANSRPSLLRDRYNKLFARELRREHGEDGGGGGFHANVHITGESSVGTGASCQTPSLLRAACGKDNVRLIYLLRDPVERMVSQHQMRVRLDSLRGGQTEDFNRNARRALSDFKAMPDYAALQAWLLSSTGSSSKDKVPPLPCPFPQDYNNPNMLWGGLYALHIARWLMHFPADRLLVLQSERFFKAPEREFNVTMRFLDLDPELVNATRITQHVFNQDTSSSSTSSSKGAVSSSSTKPDPAVLRELGDFFRPFNARLLQMVSELGLSQGEEFAPWKEY